MPEKKPIIAMQDLVKLHANAKFPIDAILLYFSDYKWVAKFFENCIAYLREKGKIKFDMGDEEKVVAWHWPKGMKALNRFVTKSLGYKRLDLRQYLRQECAISLLVIGFLIKTCKQDYTEVQKQIVDMRLRCAASKRNIGMKVIYILHYSTCAMLPNIISKKNGS